MRLFLYGIASFCGFIALALLLFPIVTGLQNLDNGFAALFSVGLAANLAPFAVALAVIPLCIAFAFDRMTS